MSSRFHYALQFAQFFSAFAMLLSSSFVNHVLYWKYMVTFYFSLFGRALCIVFGFFVCIYLFLYCFDGVYAFFLLGIFVFS